MAEVKIQMYEWVDVFADTLFESKRKDLAKLTFHSIGAGDQYDQETPIRTDSA